jgi:hypothetical protein
VFLSGLWRDLSLICERYGYITHIHFYQDEFMPRDLQIWTETRADGMGVCVCVGEKTEWVHLVICAKFAHHCSFREVTLDAWRIQCFCFEFLLLSGFNASRSYTEKIKLILI